jgi:hypothetical protein
MNEKVLVFATGFKQRHFIRWVRAQPVGYHTSSTACANNYIVKFQHCALAPNSVCTSLIVSDSHFLRAKKTRLEAGFFQSKSAEAALT